MQTERILFFARLQCENCGGSGVKIRPEVHSFRKEIEGKDEEERKAMRGAFYARYQYDVLDEPVQACTCCRGYGYREEWVKIVNEQIKIEVIK